MLFGSKAPYSFRTRLLLYSIASAGAGVLLLYCFASSDIKEMAAAESGSRLLIRLKQAAAETSAIVQDDLAAAVSLADSTEVKALLSGRKAIGGRAASFTLTSAAKKHPPIAAAALLSPTGTLVAAYYADPNDSGLPTAQREELDRSGIYISPPIVKKGYFSFEAGLPVRAGEASHGTLLCRFKPRNLPDALNSSGGRTELSMFKREGGELKGIMSSGRTLIQVTSQEAAKFIRSIQGKEGYSTITMDGETHIFAHTFIRPAAWIFSASFPYLPSEVSSATAGLKKLRLHAGLIISGLSLLLFITVKSLGCPIADSSRLASGLLAELGAKVPDSNSCDETKIINAALTEAFNQLRKREESGMELEKEAEKLREEDEDLKYQNMQLDKINQYLLEREARIAELKKELRELQQKVEQGKK